MQMEEEQEKLTGYEIKRLQNIKRNNQMLSSFKIHSISHRARVKSYKASPSKKIKSEPQIAIRQSLRTKRKPPDASTARDLEKNHDKIVPITPKVEISPFESDPDPCGTNNVNLCNSLNVKPEEVSHCESIPNHSSMNDVSCSICLFVKLEEAISCSAPPPLSGFPSGLRDVNKNNSLNFSSSPSLSLSNPLSPMAPKILTVYEHQRLENIKRNKEMLSFLQVQSKLDDLSSAAIAHRAQFKANLREKKEPKTPTVIRQSLRTRGKPPEASTAGGLERYFESVSKNPRWQHFLKLGSNPFSMKDASCSGFSDKKLTDVILGASKKSESYYDNVKPECSESVSYSLDWTSLRLEPNNIANVVPNITTIVRFFPSMDMSLIAVGNKQGKIGFWLVNGEKKDGNTVYLYHPHPRQVSGIAIHPFSLSKVYSSCCDGFIRLMHVEKEVYESIFSGHNCIFSLSHQQSDANTLYFGEGRGVLHIWDIREGKSSMSCNLHGHGINSIDFSSENTNIMATSSRDETACIWDLRYMSVDNPKSLKIVNHTMAVDSAYFSPSGNYLATTSHDNRVGLLSGANFEDVQMINYHNWNPSIESSSRAIWGWDDSYLFIGSINGGVDIISTTQKRKLVTLRSGAMCGHPFYLAAHPYNNGVLAGASNEGYVHVWTTC